MECLVTCVYSDGRAVNGNMETTQITRRRFECLDSKRPMDKKTVNTMNLEELERTENPCRQEGGRDRSEIQTLVEIRIYTSQDGNHPVKEGIHLQNDYA